MKGWLLRVLTRLLERLQPDAALTDTERKALALLASCPWCGGKHPGACPYVDCLEFEGTHVAKVVLRPEHYRDLRDGIVWGA